jgi:hypothetical protein
MNEENRDFANELIKQYGEDRFYHCCMRTSSPYATAEMWLLLNADDSLTREENKRNCHQFLESISIRPGFVSGIPLHPVDDFMRADLCRIAFGFCRWWKEFGLKKMNLPANIHARMVLGENNEWVRNYVKLLNDEP